MRLDADACVAGLRLGRAVGNELREFVLNVALHIPGVVGVCAVTRTRGFRAKQRVTGVRGGWGGAPGKGVRVVAEQV